VKAKNESAVAQMLAAVIKAGVPGKDAQTEFVYLEPRYRNWETREVLGYIARRTVKLTLRMVANRAAGVELILWNNLVSWSKPIRRRPSWWAKWMACRQTSAPSPSSRAPADPRAP